MYKIEITHQYLKDVKLARKRQLDENKLNQIIQLLAIGQALPLKNKDHALTGTYSGFRECHIQPDWLLIYAINHQIQIVRLYEPDLTRIYSKAPKILIILSEFPNAVHSIFFYICEK